MKHPFTLICALSLSAGLFFSRELPAASAGISVLAPQPASQNCKPEAPIRLELFPSDLIGGRSRVDYVVTPVMDALAIEVTVEFPGGGNPRWHTPPARGAAERGRELGGALSVDLPTNLSGVEVIVRAHISIPDAEAPDGIGVYTTSRSASWGDLVRSVNGVTETVIDGELTLDTAATRL